MEDDGTFHPTFIGASASDERNDDFDFLNGEDDPAEDAYWLSQEQVREMHQRRPVGEYPTPSERKEDRNGSDLLDITITLLLSKLSQTRMAVLRLQSSL